jgi:hypothetical protein
MPFWSLFGGRNPVGRSSYVSNNDPIPLPPLPPRILGTLSASTRLEKFYIERSNKHGMVWSLYVRPYQGQINPTCLNDEHFWTAEGIGEIYVARNTYSVDHNGKLTVEVIGFCRNAQPELDEYWGTSIEGQFDSLIPEEDPFELREKEKSRQYHNAHLLKKHLQLVLLDE